MATTAILGCDNPVGAAIARRLRSDGHEVLEAPAGASSPDLKEALAGATVVVHAGGAGDTAALLEVASGIGADHLVLLSSAAVYGAWPDNPIPLTEDAIVRPNLGIAAVAERGEIERRSQDWVLDHPGMALAVLRPCTVVVPDRPDWPSDDLDGVAGLGSGDGARPVQFLHVDDLAAAVSTVVGKRITGVRNVAPAGWITEEEARALSGGRVVALPEPVRRAARRLTIGTRVDRGVAALSSHPWVVASDALRADGWAPVYDNREALVATRRATWWQRLSPTKRQELSMAVVGGAALIAIVATALGVRHKRQTR